MPSACSWSAIPARVLMCTVLTSIVNPVYKIDFTTMVCLDFFKNSSINAYNPKCNPEFIQCIKHVSTDTTTSVYNSFFPNYESTHVSACQPKVHQPVAKTHATGGGAWFVGMAYPVNSVFTSFFSSLKENMFGSTFYNTTNLPVHISNYTPTVALVIM